MPTELEYAKKERLEMHSQITEEMHYTYDAKNCDYGNSYAKVREDHGIDQFLIYAKTKINRIESLAKKGDAKVDESIEDSLKDLANYCIMEMIEGILDKKPRKEEV